MFLSKPKSNVFNELALLASIILSSVIYSNAQAQDYGNYDFAGFDGSGFEQSINQPNNNLNRPDDDRSVFQGFGNQDDNLDDSNFRPPDFRPLPDYQDVNQDVNQNDGNFRVISDVDNDGGVNVFDTQTTEDPFRTQQNEFPRDDDFNRQQQFMNDFQNNEIGSDTQQSPFGNDNLGQTSYTRDRGPDVDEFGNPLDDIHSTDTTRFELGTGGDADALKCPRHWYQFQGSCYKFTRSPELGRDEASELCREYRHQATDKADLASISSLEEHRFVQKVLNEIDPQHRRWYISAKQTDQKTWKNLGDKTLMQNLQEYFLQTNELGGATKKQYLAYGFSKNEGRWGFLPVYGDDEYLSICEMPIEEVSYLMTDGRTFQYGEPIGDPRYYPMGPFFIRQPNNTVFDVGRRKIINDISLLCVARGWPTPSYTWFREIYQNDSLLEHYIDPMKDSRVTISGGQLIINNPNQIGNQNDRGKYFCKASNKYGTIRSRSVSIAFGFIGEFILRRSDEVGHENWGKAISCDPPQHFPDIKYYWSRDYFPNFVEEDRRVMVSYDGYLYFSALDKIDGGNYSCSVQSSVADHGRNGPFFTLKATPHPDYQQLRFPQNFPKVFPQAPVAGEDVRLECIAFGYPVPHYNWTRKGSDIPEGAIITNHQRVLILRRVRVEDQGEYICRAHNDRVSITGSVVLSIQARPVFTISIGDKHIDENDDLTWTCEAFGIPDVEYAWLKNGRPIYDWKAHHTGEDRACKRRRQFGSRSYNKLNFDKDAPGTAVEDRDRYEIKCGNILKIKKVRKDRDEGMYQCMAYNDLDTRYSSGQIRVLGDTQNKEKWRPSFAKHPLEEKMFAAEGGNITIKCEPEGAPQPKFIWRKNGNRIASGGKNLIDRNGTRLFIRQVNMEDQGTYTCVATNKNGQAESTGRLVVIRGPSFQGGRTKKPNPRRIVNIEDSVEIGCRASGEQSRTSLDMAYSWRLNGLKIRFFEDDEKERVLQLKNAPGNRARISAGAGGDRAFTELSDHQRLLVGSSSWYQGAVERYTKGTGSYNKYRRGRLDGTLIISNISYAEAGKYECVVNSAVGTIYAHSEVIVHGKPGKPGGVSASNLDSQSGKVVWTDGTIYGKEITSYRIDGRTNHNDTWITLADRVQGQEEQSTTKKIKIDRRKSYRLYRKLSPYSRYEFRVAAYNIYGLGVFSDSSPTYSTLADKPMRSVTGVKGGGGKTGDLVISWDPLPDQEHNAPGVYYRVYYKRTGIDPDIDFVQETIKKPNEIGYSDWQTNERNGKMIKVIKIDPRYYFTTYDTKIQVFNQMCEEPRCDGPVSDPVSVFSAEDLPQVAPSTVGARPYNSTALVITWVPVPDVREKMRGKLIGHRIKYWRKDLNETTESQYLLSRSERPVALIIGLQPNAYYWVRVMAYNSAGPGPESERFLERTFKLRPQKPPTAVQVYGINPSTIRVTWRYVAPSVHEEPLTGYKVRVWETDKDVSQANDTEVLIGHRLETTITNLTPGKTYYLRVLAYSQGGEGKMSSPVWQFQMGDPEALNSAEPRFQFMALHNRISLTSVVFTTSTIILQILMARIL